MIKVLSLAAALALLPLSLAVAQDRDSAAEAALDSAAAAFEARMEAFGERAEAIEADATLSEDDKERKVEALWAEYQPDLAAFTATVTRHASEIAAQALEAVDVGALVQAALSDPEVQGAMRDAGAVAAGGPWASQDPEHRETFGLMAEYAVGQMSDDLEEAQAEIDAAVAEAEAEADSAPSR